MTPPADGHYRPHLDGLRAVAVYLVVAFHAGLARATGGFIGVDVFFVLSGYLVTSVLLRDVASNGRVRLARFYARRVRRLLPAAVVTLLVTLVVFTAVSDEVVAASARSAAKAAFLYVANWFFVRRSADYFATDAEANPFLHFWSLAVEEQFYLVWPLLLTGILAATRRLPGPSRRWAQAVVMGGGLLSAGLALAWRASALDRAYFGTDTRAYQLLAGALLALTPGVVARLRRRARLADALAVVCLGALVAVGSSLWATGPIARGVVTAVVTCGAIAGTEAAASGWAARALSLPPVVYLGRISYGTYLWHWPVIVILAEVRPMSPRSLLAVVAVLGTALAALSYELVERPVRTWRPLDRRPLPVALSGVATGAVAALLLVPALPDSPGREQPTAAVADSELGRHLTRVPADYSYGDVYYGNPPDFVQCVGQPASACTVERGQGPHLLLMGDSTMHALVPAFRKMARDHDLTLSLGTRPGCLWPEGVYVLTPDIRASCRAIKEDLYARVIAALHPDVILMMDTGPPADTDTTRMLKADKDRQYRDGVIRSIPVLARLAPRVVVIEPLPKITPILNPAKCLRTARYAEECRFRANAEPTWMEQLIRQQAQRYGNVEALDIDRLACPAWPVCDPIVDGRVVWWDGQHLAHDYVVSIADQLHDRLAGAGFLSP